MTVAAKEGGGDIDGNPSLALAVQKARDASMPKDNIERAIAKGTGAGADAAALETIMYEGYGPGGVALLIEAVTDNRNRTGADVRHALSKGNGSLGEPGSVAYNFDKKGVIAVDAGRYSEDDLMIAIDAGAEDISLDDDVYEIVTDPSDLTAVRAALEEAGIELQNAEVVQRPKVLVPVDDPGYRHDLLREEGSGAGRTILTAPGKGILVFPAYMALPGAQFSSIAHCVVFIYVRQAVFGKPVNHRGIPIFISPAQ